MHGQPWRFLFQRKKQIGISFSTFTNKLPYNSFACRRIEMFQRSRIDKKLYKKEEYAENAKEKHCWLFSVYYGNRNIISSYSRVCVDICFETLIICFNVCCYSSIFDRMHRCRHSCQSSQESTKRMRVGDVFLSE